MDKDPPLHEDKELVRQLQDEVLALVTAWADRGVSPAESAMILTSNGHAILAKLGFSLGELVSLMTDGWKRNNGKL